MELITDSKDERLNDPNQHNTQSGAMQEFLELYRESLMCLLNSQEDHGPNLAGESCCCNDCLYGTHEELFARCNTALTRAEAAEEASIAMSHKEGYVELETRIIELATELELAEKERDDARGQLCRATALLKWAADSQPVVTGPRTLETFNTWRMKPQYHDEFVKKVAALSSSSPCAHAERVKELEQRLAYIEPKDFPGLQSLLADSEAREKRLREAVEWAEGELSSVCVEAAIELRRRAEGGPMSRKMMYPSASASRS